MHPVGVFLPKCLLVFLNTYTPRYYSRADAENAMRYINGTRLDDRIIRTDWEGKCDGIYLFSDLGALDFYRKAGFQEGRQYGRGRSGGQGCYKGTWTESLPGIPVTIQVFSSVCGYSFVRNLCLLVLIRFGVGVWGLPEIRSCQVAKLTSNLRSNPLASAS